MRGHVTASVAPQCVPIQKYNSDRGLTRLFHKGTLPAWLFYPLTLYSNTMHYKNKNDILYNLLIYNSLYALRFGYAVSLLSPKRALSANKLSHAADYESTSCTFAVFVYLFDNDSFITVSAPLHEISGLKDVSPGLKAGSAGPQGRETVRIP